MQACALQYNTYCACVRSLCVVTLLAIHTLLRARLSRGKLQVGLCTQIYIRMDEQCKTLCKIDSLTANQAKAFKGKIEDEYRVLM